MSGASHGPAFAIVAMADNGVIGRGDGLPWHLPDDLKRFKALTMGHAMLMGRMTWDSIGRPLPGRRSLVLTRNAGWSAPGAERVASLTEALERAGGAPLAVIGGAEVFSLAWPAVGDDTRAGLPRRVPQANLVPGSAAEPEPHVRIVRGAESIAAHTSGYFRGWRRGQEIGGYAVGQRDRAAWEFNRDQRARDGMDQPARLSR